MKSVLAGGFGMIVVMVFSSCGDALSGQDIVAMYDNGCFWRDSNFSEFITPVPGGDTLADVHIELPDGRTFALREFPEDVAIEIADNTIQTNGGRIRYYYDGDSYFVFREGRLIGAKLVRGSPQYRISPSEEGPYVELPIEHDRLVEVFGEPHEWQPLGRRPHGI
ncbi:MAG: hypothetical protein R3C10_20755 [Pirellulales bacterium]